MLAIGGGKVAPRKAGKAAPGKKPAVDVRRRVALPVVADVMRGVNAYGQTGSGKTHSLQCADADDAGLLPRVVLTLFVHATIDATHQYSIEAAAVLHRRS